MIERTSLYEAPKPRYVYGLSGLAKLIGCSKPTAHKIKDSGTIPYAKIGKKFIFDEEKVMAALSFNGKELSNG
jgi:excisionase family DNA binding protein